MLIEFEGQHRLVQGVVEQIKLLSNHVQFWASTLNVAVPVGLVD